MSTQNNERAGILSALAGVGHTPAEADQILRRAEECADIIAAREDAGIESPMDGGAEMLAEDFRTYLPMVWAFAIAGHTGGGSGAQASTDAGIEAMQFQPTERAPTPGDVSDLLLGMQDMIDRCGLKVPEEFQAQLSAAIEARTEGGAS